MSEPLADTTPTLPLDVKTKPVNQVMSKFLDEAQANFGKRPALSYRGKTLKYRQWSEQADRAAGGLKEMGVRPGSRVVLALPPSPHLLILLQAVWRAGATPLLPLMSTDDDELAQTLVEAEAHVLITLNLTWLWGRLQPLPITAKFKRIVIGHLGEYMPWWKRFFYWLFGSGKVGFQTGKQILRYKDLLKHSPLPAENAPKVDPNELALLFHERKADGLVVANLITHKNLSASLGYLKMWLAGLMKPGQEKTITALPLSQLFSLIGQILLPMVMGARIELEFETTDDQKLTRIKNAKPSWLLLDQPTLARLHAWGKAALPLFKRLKLVLLVPDLPKPAPFEPNADFAGATLSWLAPSETSGLLALSKPNEPEAYFPMPRQTIQRHPSSGEILLKGVLASPGYWHKPALSDQSYVGESVRTGVIAEIGSEGSINFPSENR